MDILIIFLGAKKFIFLMSQAEMREEYLKFIQNYSKFIQNLTTHLPLVFKHVHLRTPSVNTYVLIIGIPLI